MNPDKNQHLEYKKKCLQIVQKYIEIFDNNGKLIKFPLNEFLIDCHYLTKSYYEDLTEERASIDFCGYTLCDERLSKTTKKQFKLNQNYQIRNNKVYEITRRKKFCSDQCFRQSEYIKNQISSEPIFLRKNDDLSHRITLYNGHDGQHGEEIKLIDTITTVTKEKQTAVKRNELRKKLLNNEKSIESKLSAPYIKEEEFSELKHKFKNFNIQEKLIDETKQLVENTNDEKELLEELDRMSISTASSMTNLSTISSSRNGKLKKRKFFENIVKRISSWITDDTRKLLGIDVNIAMQQNSIQLPEIVEYEDDEKKMERYRWEYIRLCARLNEEEIEDEKYDRMVCEERKRSKTNKKSVIKQNSSSTISPNNDSKETKMVRFTDDTKHDDGPIDSEKNNDDNDDGEMFFLPLNDNQHASVKRKQLFLQEIHTFLQEILENQIENDEIFQQIHSLIRTFNLNSETTVLGRKENFLISIFLFRILILYRMLGDESNEFDVKYKSNIFIIKILDRFQLTFESIDENIDKIFNDDKK